MPPSKYTTDEIQNNMFLPLMKKALMRAYGADTKTSLSLVFVCPLPLVCYAPGAEIILGEAEFVFVTFRRYSAPDEKHSSSHKMQYAPDKKHPAHA